MTKHHADEAFDVAIEGGATGLTDVTVKFLNLATGVEGAALDLAQVGSTKYYRRSVTLSDVGTYVATFESPTDSIIGTGDNAVKRSLIIAPISRDDLGGADFDSADDGLSVIADIARDIKTKVDNIEAAREVHVVV